MQIHMLADFVYVRYSGVGASATASRIDEGNGAGLVATFRWAAVT